nr:ATP-binding protein [Pseudonocardia sp. C8]
MVVGVGDRAQGRPITIYAAQELGPVHDAVETVGWLVAGGVPVLVLIAGFFTYLFAGSALRPVEQMRARVAGMTDKDLSQRVPEPAARDEVGRLARTMNQMLGRLESSQATQRRFVADASHELRSPLATVSTGLELLGTGMPEGSADRATVDTLRGETTRLTGLVEGLLFLARADERGLVPRREEVDLDEIAEAERVRPSGETAVAVRVTTEPVRVVGDRGQLVRVVRNLVDNAKRHARSTVAVSVRAADGVAVIDVDDDGNGVPEADRSRVFERFVRLDEARSRGDGGSGLGLSIVSELVAAHGGTVAALESPELGGARFRVTVPATAPDPDGAGNRAPAAVDGAPVDEPRPAAGAGQSPAGADDAAAAGLDGSRGPAVSASRGSQGSVAPGPDEPRGSILPGSDGSRGSAVSGSEGSRGSALPGSDRTGGPAVAGPDGSREPAAPDRNWWAEPPAPGPNGSGVPAAPGQAGGPAHRPDLGRSSTVADHEGGGPARPPNRRPDPSTGPLPIRPDTVGSPYDENATRPIPVSGARAARHGTAVANRERTGEQPTRPTAAGRPPVPRGHGRT